MSKKPYTKQQLLKWSCFRIENNYNPKDKDADFMHPFKLVHTPLTELVKQPGYEHFKDRLNWLYNNFSEQNYDLVWNEIQEYNNQRKYEFIRPAIIPKAEYILRKRVQEAIKHFGEIPSWIEGLSDNQRKLLLDRARTCYGLIPEEIELQSKQLYTVPERVVKELNKHGEATYYSQEELYKAHYKYTYTEVIGKVKVYSEQVKRVAENAVIRDASWMARFNDTEFDLREHREEYDTSLEDKLQDALKFIENNRGKYPPEELLQIVVYLYDIDLSEKFKNKMVPITDMQGPDSPYGLDIEFRDFQEPIYGEDEGL